MPKKLIQKLIDKFIPDPEVIKQHKSLQFLGDKLHEPNLWHLNRRSIALAFAVGLFCAWIPAPAQMVFAAMGAIYYRANIPISVALVWITNPITMPPLYYFAYEVGLSFLNQPTSADESEFSLSNIFSSLGDVWQPFLVGCLIMGIVSSTAGYFGIHYYWQYHVNKKWAERKEKRLAAQDTQIEDINNELD
ncbi:DUF2062 domain-containing protein [Methylobacter tundripaludum]|uniref:DUF2062 domain-containing protein n=1 Tax=Methylobacter tundripaludum TaxID=173365 RepID=UPI000561D295|nr:DUF2062 domain-containing protein [Methylobacter tundripaludum]